MPDWFDEGGTGSPLDVQGMWDSQPLQDVISLIVAHGALVSFGVTSDGGALGITVTVDGRWRREYFRTSEDAADWLSQAEPSIRAAVEAARASSGRGRRSRRT
jgi:hypothetical protein